MKAGPLLTRSGKPKSPPFLGSPQDCVVLNMLQKCETRDRASKINSVFEKKKKRERERKMRKGILRIRGNILYPRGNMEYNTIQKN